jgi:tetratricopeptide (TPR) repeat protein
MPQRAGKPDGGSQAKTLPDALVEEAEPAASDDDGGSIDHLLAASDRGWEVEDQVLTLRQAAAETGATFEASAIAARVSVRPPVRSSKGPPPLPRKLPPPVPPPASGRPPPIPPSGSRAVEPPAGLRTAPTLAELTPLDGLIESLQARVASLETRGDRVGMARVLVELAVATETLSGDDRRAAAHAQTALRMVPTFAPAHAILRRANHGRAALASMLDHLEHEAAATSLEARRVALLAERARLLDAMGGRGDEVRAAWEQALEHAPAHPAALKGLEAELVARTAASGQARDWDALAAHLGRMADAYAGDAPLAAWLHVERARVLERKLDRPEAARAALERALELHPRVGPVRDAMVRHVAAHGDWAALSRLLDEEAGLEDDSARAARLELDAACIAGWRLGDPGRARALLERAAARAPTAPNVDRRVLDEIVRLAEGEGLWVEAARARRTRLEFLTEPAALAYELRTLAAVAEREGDTDTAIADVQRALSLDAAEPGLIDWLDRLLAAAGKHEPRIATWLQEAARSEDAERRAQSLARAAGICEHLGRRDDAIRHLRSAWVAAPGNADALEGLARLLGPSRPEPVDGPARSLAEVYFQAANLSPDPGRKVAYLERVALLWEEVLGDPERAVRAYERVLSIEPDRRSAMVGLQRVAARLGDDRTLARALLDETRVTADPAAQRELRSRAAAALATVDPARAIQLVREVLDEDGSDEHARELESRLYQEAGRWELAAKSLRSQIDAAPTARRKVALWLSLAQIQHVRLRLSHDALVSLERARSLDPTHPVPPEEAARVLESHGDARALRDVYDRLASNAKSPGERARHLARAAEIDELRLGDDAAAARSYQRALAETPEDDLLAERFARLIARRARKRTSQELTELTTLLGKRIDRASSPAVGRPLAFELASTLVEAGQEPMRAVSLLESLLEEQPDAIPALRSLEGLRRRGTVDAASLAAVLDRQGRTLRDPAARLGALWSLAALQEWSLAAGGTAATYKAIAELDPADPSALDASLRCNLAAARRGEAGAKAAVVAALRGLVPLASDEDSRLALVLRLALLLETTASDAVEGRGADEQRREALEWYRDALRRDGASPTASAGVARLSVRLGDAEGALAAAHALAALVDDPKVRARCLLEGAELLLGPDDARLGPRAERRQRAAGVLERALDADPDSTAVASRLTAVMLEERQDERLVSAFRAAMVRAKSVEATVMLGTEVARVARAELRDLPLAIDAMRRVRAAAPQHVPSLLTLAELCIAQRVWPDAVDALEAVVTTSREPGPRLTALFALASIYEKVLARPAEVDRVLRTALAIEPANVRALKALLRRLAAEPVDPDPAAARVRRREIADLLGRLAGAETDLDLKSGILLELSEVHTRLGDAGGAERALVEATAASPSNPRALARLTAFFKGGRGPEGLDAAGYARALGSVISLGDPLGRADARWFAALGQVEIEALQRPAEGIAHLQRAVELDPALYSTRIDLARALAHAANHVEAARVLLGMIAPSAHPLLSVAEPTAALELLERSLGSAGRSQESLFVTELRAVAGDLDEARGAWLRARRLPAGDAQQPGLDRQALVTHVVPAPARHVLLEIAAAIAGAETKVVRGDLGDLGVSPRDRVPARSGHPTRALLDRVARQLALGDLELVITARAKETRVLAQDVPWVIVPAAVAEMPESTQLASLARVLARVALGVPWLRELSPPNIEALLVAAARQVAPSYGRGGKDVAGYDAALARVLTRRQKKFLEELAPHLAAPKGAPPRIEDLVEALTRAEIRTALVLTGDLLAVVDEAGLADAGVRSAARSPGSAALAALLEHPWIGDAVRFGLTPEATSLRRRVGAIWQR